MKRPFHRRAGVLFDAWEGPGGRPHQASIPACSLGEEPDAATRQELIRDLGSGSATEHLSIYGLRCDASDEKLEGLLRSLESQQIVAPMELTHFLDDPRVQPALIEAARAAPAREVANFAQVVGLVGGPGSREVLRARLSELVQSPDTYKADPFFNSHAGSLATVAEALLRLEGDADHAARELVKLLEHPVPFNRSSAARTMADCFDRDPCIQVRELLAEGLGRILAGENDEVFLAAARSLMTVNFGSTLKRLESLLRDESEEVRTSAAHALGQAGTGHRAARCLALLRDRFQVESSLRLCVTIAGYLRELAPTDRTRDIAQRALADESPWLRRQAILLLVDLEPHWARSLAKQALSDEPDPILKKQLQRAIDRCPADDSE